MKAATEAPKWDALVAKCKESPAVLSREVQFGYQDLKKHNVAESYDELVAHLNHSIPNDAGGATRCDGVLAAYLTLVEPS